VFKTLDPRELPSYSPAEAARYLRMPVSTLRTWFFGYPAHSMLPVIQPADPKRRLLSFLNLVEAHVLDSIRDHQIPLPKVRRSLLYIQKTLKSKHPLAQHQFETSGRDLFVKYFGELIGVSLDGQTAMSDVLRIYLQRIEWDEAGLAKKFYPYVHHGIPETNQPQVILIDPTISGGRPVLVGTGISTRVVAERYLAGESPDDLAKDYNRTRPEIDEILRCEVRLAA
jgi:uncharacterized protein (DUF433 family)